MNSATTIATGEGEPTLQQIGEGGIVYGSIVVPIGVKGRAPIFSLAVDSDPHCLAQTISEAEPASRHRLRATWPGHRAALTRLTWKLPRSVRSASITPCSAAWARNFENFGKPSSASSNERFF